MITVTVKLHNRFFPVPQRLRGWAAGKFQYNLSNAQTNTYVDHGALLPSKCLIILYIEGPLSIHNLNRDAS